jgi:hypothetical protein
MVKTQPDEGAMRSQARRTWSNIRWFPSDTTNHLLSQAMSSIAVSINSHGDPKNGLFENHSTVNKYSFIMNPPFGVSGKTAMEHLYKIVT